jgi:hypothetical protein
LEVNLERIQRLQDGRGELGPPGRHHVTHSLSIDPEEYALRLELRKAWGNQELESIHEFSGGKLDDPDTLLLVARVLTDRMLEVKPIKA